MSRLAPQVQSDIVADLPEGFAWTHDPASVTARSYAGLADAIARFDAAAEAQVAEATPDTATVMLEDYERVLGPDTCLGDAATLPFEIRRLSVVSRWTQPQDASIPGLIALAAAYGVAVTITEGRRSVVGLMRMGDPIMPHPNEFSWVVGMPTARLVPFQMGVSSMGDPLGLVLRNTQIECVISRAAPAHTTPVFSYGPFPGVTTGVWDGNNWDDGSVWA